MSTKAEAHDLISELHRLSAELGHVPTRDEYQEHARITRDRLVKVFGSYAVALEAAGLSRKAPQKKASELLRLPVPTREIPETPSRSPIAATTDATTVLVLGDLHFPWANVDALSGVFAFVAENPQIDAVVQVGDLYDLFAWSRFSRSLASFSPQEEIERGREMAEDLWKKIRALLPHAALYQLKGNHDSRPLLRCLDKAPELEPFLALDRFFEFEGVRTVHDPREPLELAGYTFIHGHLSRLGDHARHYLRSIVCGHTHRGGVVTMALGDGRVISELNAGYLANASSRPMGYLPTRMNAWTLGFGLIDRWGPRFIPLGQL